MSRMTDVEVKIHWETEKAWLVSTNGEKDDAVWINKILAGEELECDEQKSGRALITMPEWYATEKGLV